MKNKSSPIQDEPQRLQALNPQLSFIVQAPAGSGKTELLTQRFLVLLATVNAPEEILAITFTKKSAAEMRTRIITALKNAHAVPRTDHEYKTQLLAQKALQRDAQLGWNLLLNPNRLRLQTLDSFNAHLTKQLPLLSQFGAMPQITEQPSALYQEAIETLFFQLDSNQPWTEAITQLLRHMDNNLTQVQNLLMTLLAKRDQWLPYIAHVQNDPFLRARLEQGLQSVTLNLLQKIQWSFPADLKEEWLLLADYAAVHSATPYTYHTWPTTTLADYAQWQQFAKILLTNTLTWRKRFDKSVGFPPATDFLTRDEKQHANAMKKRMQCFVEKLQANNALKAALSDLLRAPAHYYQPQQWQILNALHHVLLISVASLKVVFQAHNKIDYIENAQAALTALGTDDEPTDLALSLDYQIRHILVDEFQDTSHSQYRLLTQLTLGWESNDGRSLFLVGDPMQSIYRFREADVGLFIRARQQGLGAITLIPLTLCVNFRSTATLVNWVNHHFSHAFPPYDDISTGAVIYSPSVALTTSDATPAVHTHAFYSNDSDEQAQHIITLVKQAEQTNPQGTIAILVRSRTHLKSIISALKQAQCLYRAMDIDPLLARATTQDLLALTRALHDPGDRTAWLAILRAPWAGLTLDDLLALTNHHTGTLWEALQHIATCGTMSPDGRTRGQRVMAILQNKILQRQRYSLRQWVENTWYLLGGPACVENSADLMDADTFFQLLEQLDCGGQLPNLASLETALRQSYAAPNLLADDRLQIMTIHSAKGLEFDTVILPHLERKPPAANKQLMLWMETPGEDNSSELMIAPIHATGDATDSIYEYIKRTQTIKTDHENARLLYVAATRAKKQLHLLFNVALDSANACIPPVPGSLLNKLWPALCATLPPPQITQTHHTVLKPTPALLLRRLSATWQNPVREIPPVCVATHQQAPGFQQVNQYTKHIGIITHRILQQMGTLGTAWWLAKKYNEQHAYLQQLLRQSGVNQAYIAQACVTIMHALMNTLNDAKGCWILDNHDEAKNEYALTASLDNTCHSIVVDRTFIDKDGVRWIIDYKTSTPAPDEALSVFLQQALTRYQSQLQLYHDVLRLLDTRPIRVGLYFPLIPAWYEWQLPT